ncbi:hypothetical protein NQ318_008707 [Aromia moschata]|uniref:Uncharacterized protein n=1 Tax=Aromia moschata TaxID=1265417 RepID=A0AAV8XBU9_9CUCU|nr:hypothetical protein NQ318_008707 [Aromia moschata]
MEFKKKVHKSSADCLSRSFLSERRVCDFYVCFLLGLISHSVGPGFWQLCKSDDAWGSLGIMGGIIIIILRAASGGAKRVAWPPPNESGPESPYVEQNSVTAKGGPQYPSQSPGLHQNNYQAPAQQSVSSNPPSHRPLKPLDVSTADSSPSSTPNKGWAPVQSPLASPSQPSWPQGATRQRSSSTSLYQSAHQSVSQQSFLGQFYQLPSPQSQASDQQQYQALQQQYQPSRQPLQQQFSSPQQQYQPPQQQYQPPQQQYQSPQQQYQPPQQQNQPPHQQYQPPQQQYQPSQQQYQPPQQQYQPPQQQHQPPQQKYQSPQQQYQPPQQQYQATSQQYQSQTSQISPKPAAAPTQAAPKAAGAKPVEPPPSTITLRSQAPVRQAPPPVVTSQPATATLRVKVGQKHMRGDQKWPPEDIRRQLEEETVDNNYSFLSIQGGKHLRGDLKWPPENVKRQWEEENRLRLELAKGPAVRPPRPNKDYTEFFEQHALNSTYPGYKIPPGTQFYRPL